MENNEILQRLLQDDKETKSTVKDESKSKATKNGDSQISTVRVVTAKYKVYIVLLLIFICLLWLIYIPKIDKTLDTNTKAYNKVEAELTNIEKEINYANEDMNLLCRDDWIVKNEEILNIFFTQAYADIKNVEYKIEERDDKIKYRLYFNKQIGGELKSIPVEIESEGTRRIIEEFSSLMGALKGETVIIDEIDNGIHDLLIKNIFESLLDKITGQLIVTTHNTLLLESSLSSSFSR